MSMQSPAQYEVLGAVKIMDGVFIGDDLAAQDLEFVVANKVTHVINCAGRQVPNHYETIGVMYSTHFWQDNETEVILDHKDVVTNDIFNFIDGCLSSAESVLIHSVRGQSRSCCVLAAYLMKKYSWTLRKTMEFMLARRPDLNLSRNFLEQLSAYERRLSGKQRLTDSWTDFPASSRANPLGCEELLLRNTYLNSQMSPGSAARPSDVKERGTGRLVWADNGTDDKSILESMHDMRVHKRIPSGEPEVKSILQKRKSKDHNGLQSRPTTASSETDPQLSKDRDDVERSSCWELTSGDLASCDRREKPISAWEDDVNGSVRSTFLDSRDMRGFDARECRDRDVRDAERDWRVSSRDSMRDNRDMRDRDDSRHRMPSPSHDQASTRGRFLPNSKPKSDRYESPGSRSRRAPSPKSDRERYGPRSDSPLRLLTKNPQSKNQGISQGSLPSRSSNVLTGPSLTSLRTPVQNGGVMGAYRGGPVKAKVEFLAADCMRQRPSTAPITRQSNNRPASPIGVCRQSSNGSTTNPRPFSNTRPLSPNTRPQPRSTMTSLLIYDQVNTSFSPSAYPVLEKQTRTLSSHMRRAPSPTPAFNRATSPNKPRWRM